MNCTVKRERNFACYQGSIMWFETPGNLIHDGKIYRAAIKQVTSGQLL